MPIKKCEGIFDATKEAPQCYQRHMIRFEEVNGDEDCLYLNVYTPQINSENASLPVMVWIHGGAFVCGSSKIELCDPTLLMEQDIVLVTFNYRLGMLGFMSFENAALEVPGNAGLKDQVLVLSWVRRNIKYFNGDKDNVTLFGQDAGAASVHLHMLSPISKGLFHKVILQSGCALNPWVNGVTNTGKMMGKVLGIAGSDEEILTELRQVSVELIFMAQEQLTNDNSVNTKWFCSPVVEKQKFPAPFLSDEPINIIRSGCYSKVPMIIGYAAREGIYWDLQNLQITGKHKIITDFTKVIPNNVNCDKNSLLSKTIATKIKDFYFGPRLSQSRMGRYPRLATMGPLYELLTDVFVLRGVFTTIKNHLEMDHRIPIYYYKFTIVTDLNVFKRMLPKIHQRQHSGAIHGDDLNYLFCTYLTPSFVYESQEQVAARRVVGMWTNFAKSGNPNVSVSTQWRPATKANFQCLNISEELKVEYNPDMDRMHFWREIYTNDKRTKYL